MSITPEQAQEMIRRTEINSGRLKPAAPSECPTDAAELEIEGLHEPIIKWCQSQVPMVPYIHSRTDKKSTVTHGVSDFVIFFNGKAISIECKSKNGKRTPHQIAWSFIMEKQGFKVYVVRAMSEFFTIIENAIRQ